MAIYRNIRLSFWTDTAVVDEYTVDDKLFYLYILTNPHTNLCGCYEISTHQMANEIGVDIEKVIDLLDRAANIHKTVLFSKETRELLILKWNKYNWTRSEKFRKPLYQEICEVKEEKFRIYLMKLFDEEGEKFIPYKYGIDRTDTVSASDSDFDSGIDSDADNDFVPKNDGEDQQKVYFPNCGRLDQAFKDFIQWRKDDHAPLNDKAITLTMEKLKELAMNPVGDLDVDKAVEILNQSIRNGWKGLFDIKGNSKRNSKRDVFQKWEDA